MLDLTYWTVIILSSLFSDKHVANKTSLTNFKREKIHWSICSNMRRTGWATHWSSLIIFRWTHQTSWADTTQGDARQRRTLFLVPSIPGFPFPSSCGTCRENAVQSALVVCAQESSQFLLLASGLAASGHDMPLSCRPYWLLLPLSPKII
jgi:hypothetical protein